MLKLEEKPGKCNKSEWDLRQKFADPQRGLADCFPEYVTICFDVKISFQDHTYIAPKWQTVTGVVCEACGMSLDLWFKTMSKTRTLCTVYMAKFVLNLMEEGFLTILKVGQHWAVSDLHCGNVSFRVFPGVWREGQSCRICLVDPAQYAQSRCGDAPLMREMKVFNKYFMQGIDTASSGQESRWGELHSYIAQKITDWLFNINNVWAACFFISKLLCYIFLFCFISQLKI